MFPEARKESTSAHVASSPAKYMCHFILELYLILNYFSASSLRKGHFKQASGMILTLHPIKDSQEVWNKYKVQIWDIIWTLFLLPPESQSGKSDKNISLLRRLTGLLGPRNTVKIIFQQVSEHSRPHCPLWENWTRNGWKQVSQEWTFPWKVPQRVKLHIYYHTTASSSSTSSRKCNYFHL